MKVSLLLADFAQTTPDGKVTIVGAGWSVIRPGAPFAIAALMKIPWDRANERHQFRLQLLTADGEAVLVDTENGAEPIVLEGEFEAGRPAGLKPGTELDSAIAINLHGLPLPADSRLEWRLSINDQDREDWCLPFTTRPNAQVQTLGG